jgi:hypothetical protein
MMVRDFLRGYLDHYLKQMAIRKGVLEVQATKKKECESSKNPKAE